MKNPKSIEDTIIANGDEPLGDSAQEALDNLLQAMEILSDHQRVVVFQALTDFFCVRCGREQPEGDCQCA